tara:strand:- start:24 stop:368 length:345 start_codon:yes stop_codon:yes gene_type:complete
MSDSVKKFHEGLENLVKTNQEKMTKNKEIYSFTIDKPIITGAQWYSDTTFPDKKDKYVEAVKERFEQRSQTGIKKYNTTLERDDLNLQEWLLHLQEELMDATLYIERLKEEVGS